MTNYKTYAWSREPSETGTHYTTSSISGGKLGPRINLKTRPLPSTANQYGSGDRPESLLCPRKFLERYSLPRVVRVLPQEDARDVNLLKGHLLMYAHYRTGKIEATAHTSIRGSTLLVIPETYQGWLSVVTERGQIKARCYNSVQRLVVAQIATFLVVTDITAYTLNARTNLDSSRQQYSKTTVRGGQVLKLLAVYQDIGSQSAKTKRLSWPLLSKTETNRYAQCLTSTEQMIFVPLTTTGQFYAVATTGSVSAEDTVSKVYQLPKLLRTFPLPVRVCIINGCKPQGSMLLENYRKEEVILTCLLDSPGQDEKHFRLLEIDVNSKFYVLRPTRSVSEERRLFQSDRVQSALRYCHQNWESWSRQLKVIHHIYPNEESSPKKAPPVIEPTSQQAQRQRKISLGDKKTVKSASFRFSTSYSNGAGAGSAPVPGAGLFRALPRRPKPVQEPVRHVYSNVSRESEKIRQTASELGRRDIDSIFSETGYSYSQEYKVQVGRPFYRTRLHVGSSEVPYSSVRDELPARADDGVYAEIGAAGPQES